MNSRDTQHQRGYSLVELMVVVAIVGALTTAAVMGMKTKVNAVDVAKAASNFFREASRQAVLGGPLRDDVINATGETARTRVSISVTTAAGTLIKLQRAVEFDGTPNFEWRYLDTYSLPSHLKFSGVRFSADLTGGQGPEQVGMGQYDVRCQSNGSCESMTLYFESTDGGYGNARVAIMPLNGTPQVYGAW